MEIDRVFGILEGLMNDNVVKKMVPFWEGYLLHLYGEIDVYVNGEKTSTDTIIFDDPILELQGPDKTASYEFDEIKKLFIGMEKR